MQVLFIHRYSGDMTLQTALLISCSYLFTSVNLLYAQQLSESMRPPAMDLTWLGIGLFVVGIAGNFYHHYLLSTLRKKGRDGYAVPQGGLFRLVVCPHYLFEIIGWLGMAFISQTPYGFCSLLGTTFYLMGRSYATRQWYLHKMEDFPQQRKAVFPFIF
jgi:steroid 5-alpha reductase family enzyme